MRKSPSNSSLWKSANYFFRHPPEFERLGLEPFRPFGEEKAMGYYEVPADVVEDAVHLAPWMKKAIDVAAKAKRGKTKRSK